MVERKSKKGRKFFGCSNYPDCDFVSWDEPLDEQCPLCGAFMVKSRGGKRCSNAECPAHATKEKTQPKKTVKKRKTTRTKKSGDGAES